MNFTMLDYETDAAIQKTLRTEFSKDTTLITIAHRLQTIADYDKIVSFVLVCIMFYNLIFFSKMVLDAGQLVEFDSPTNLLKKNGGYFRSLVDESDDREMLLKLVNGQ